MTTKSREPDQNIGDDFVMVSRNEPNKETAYLDAISNHIEDLSEDLRKISLSIHDNPELQFKEYHAHQDLELPHFL